MQVVNTGGSYQIFSDHLKTYNRLPAQAYTVCFNPQTGYSLVEYDNIVINEKIYGVHTEKVDKVLNSFKIFDRNLGVILSGDKGIGKSLFAKLLSIKAIEAGYPLIIVDGAVPGLANYLNSIQQEVVVLFDEFDKTFSNGKHRDDMGDPQTELLTLFDGLSQGKKLFVVTCNEIGKLNSFLVNRPGRFHYHFRFEHPDVDQIREYLVDKVPNISEREIQAVTVFSRKVALNYDCLRAIAFELSIGSTFADAIKDLNIMNINREYYNLILNLSDGTTCRLRNQCLDMFSEEETLEFEDENGKDFYVTFDPSGARYSVEFGGMLITGDEIKSVDWETEYYLRNARDNEKAQTAIKEREKRVVTSIVARRVYDKNLHYAV